MKDLEKMSRDELERLKTEVDQALKTLESRQRAEAKKAAEDAAKRYGFSLDELVGKEKGRKKSAARYRNPDDPTQTWSGRGRQPGWIKEKLEKGHGLSEFAI